MYISVHDPVIIEVIQRVLVHFLCIEILKHCYPELCVCKWSNAQIQRLFICRQTIKLKAWQFKLWKEMYSVTFMKIIFMKLFFYLIVQLCYYNIVISSIFLFNNNLIKNHSLIIILVISLWLLKEVWVVFCQYELPHFPSYFPNNWVLKEEFTFKKGFIIIIIFYTFSNKISPIILEWLFQIKKSIRFLY